MIRIAVCDDDPAELGHLAELVRSYLGARELPSHGVVGAFMSGTELLEAVSAGGAGFSLVLLDVIMPEKDGIDVARELLDTGTRVVLLSASAEYALEGYDVRALNYLLKPIEADRLFPVLDRALAELEDERSDELLVSTPGGTIRLALSDVLYVERAGRRLRYHTTSGDFDSLSIRVAFREAVSELTATGGFALAGASYAFNLERVSRVCGAEVTLVTGEVVRIPRTALVPFRSAWATFWLEARP